MIYLDYSATTKPDKGVLDTFVEVSNRYFGNPNSLHKLGSEAKNLISASTSQIATILGVKEKEIIYTSGATEANNTAIFGVIWSYTARGKEIITTPLEHSSVLEPLKYLETLGYKIKYLSLDQNGLVDIEDLKQKLSDETLLVSISSINSETGIRQDVEQIGKVLKEYPKVIFHSDVTQSIGKEKINFDFIDLASFSAQKFYGLKGIGCLIKKESISLIPLIHGGKSTTIYRSGTPAISLIASLAKALRLAYTNIEENYAKVEKLNSFLIHELKKIEDVHINSNRYSIPNIVNISILGVKAETMLHALEEEDIYLSTKTACSGDGYSLAIYTLTGDKNLASSSLRISLSHLTEKEELVVFMKILKEKVDHLKKIME